MKNIRIFLGVFIFIAAFFLWGCWGAMEVQSSSNINSIKIDGNQQDWGESLHYIKDENIAFGFKNDTDNLYIGIVTSDRSNLMKILSMGLTAWLETDKGKIGIKFPLRSEPGEMQEMRRNQNQDEEPGNGEKLKMMISNKNELQIINDNDLPLYTEEADKGNGFKGKLGYNMNQFVCELQVPLNNNKIAERIFDEKTDKVDINFVTGKFNREFRGNRTGGMRGGGEEPGEGEPGMGFPGGGRRMGEGRPQMQRANFEPLDISFDVKLMR